MHTILIENVHIQRWHPELEIYTLLAPQNALAGIVFLASGKTRVSTRPRDLWDQFLMGNDARALAARHLYCPEKKCEDMTHT